MNIIFDLINQLPLFVY